MIGTVSEIFLRKLVLVGYMISIYIKNIFVVVVVVSQNYSFTLVFVIK